MKMAQPFAGDSTILKLSTPQNWCHNFLIYNRSNNLLNDCKVGQHNLEY